MRRNKITERQREAAAARRDSLPRISATEARQLLIDVATANPDLANHGIALSYIAPDAVALHQRERDALLNPSPQAIMGFHTAWVAIRWAKRRPATISSGCGSYGGKHRASDFVEKCMKAEGTRGDYYVTNGVFIAACLAAGVVVKRVTGSQNTLVGLAFDVVMDAVPTAEVADEIAPVRAAVLALADA